MYFINFNAPPLPHYLIGGAQTLKKGASHASRSGIGVFDMLIVAEGALYIGESGREWKLEKWDLLILRPDAHHYPAAPCSEDTRFYWIHFQTGQSWEELSQQSMEEQPAELGKYSHFGNAYSLSIPKFWSIKNSDDVEKEIGALLSLNNKTSSARCWDQQASFQRLLRMICQEMHDMRVSAGQRLAESVAEYLRSCYKEPLRNEALADQFHFHSIYITRVMQHYYGCTPLHYLQRFRVEQAKLMLVNTDCSIAEIASETGFESNTYFTRCFRKIVQKTPREYRSQFRITP
ncbi:helix-turn-helix domain-containing protein [Paenibacillus sp. CAU 1782]